MKGAAAIIERDSVEVINQWVEEVRREIPAVSSTSDPVLRDHLPLLLNDIVQILKRFENMEIGAEIRDFEGMLDTSIGHGRHRSSSSGYNVEQVLKEYIILHRILSQKLKSEDVFSSEIAEILKYTIENSMLFAVQSFNESLQEMRQKLMAVIAHDLRNPVSAAYLSLGMLTQETGSPQFEKLKTMAKSSLKRSLGLIEELLESITVEAGKGMTLHFSERDLMEYVESVYNDAVEIYSNDFVLETNSDKIMGIFDTAMLRRVLENILSNAVKYGERGSPITMKVENQQEEVVISIHNEGDPIPEERQKEIFGFLHTTDNHGPRKLRSWGMGLSLVRVVAEAHGGRLKLVSNKEEGTTFSLQLNKYSNKPGKVKTALNFTYGSESFDG